MSLALIVSLVLRILVLAGIGGCVVTIRRNASASERHLLWMLTLAAIIVLPIAEALLPGLELITLPAGSADTSTAVSRDSATSLWPILITAVWIAGSLLSSLSLLMAHASARRIVRASSLNCEWSQKIGSPVLMNSDMSFAFNYGVIVPVIVLPARSITWSEELLRATLIHEAAHIARRDGASLFIAQLAQVIYWWHPAVRYVVREAARERECACDDAVLRLGVRASEYGEHLLANATPRTSYPFAVAAPLFSHSDGLLPRIANLLDSRNHGVVRRTTVYSAVAVGLPLLAVVASATPVARRLPVEAAVVAVPPVFAQTPAAAPNPVVTDSVHKKRERPAARDASSKRKRNPRQINPATATAVSAEVTQPDFAGAAIFPVDVKKFARLAGSMGRLARQMASGIDSAKLGAAR